MVVARVHHPVMTKARMGVCLLSAKGEDTMSVGYPEESMNGINGFELTS